MCAVYIMRIIKLGGSDTKWIFVWRSFHVFHLLTIPSAVYHRNKSQASEQHAHQTSPLLPNWGMYIYTVNGVTTERQLFEKAATR
jgi:hypothetical protein